jgi:hypothetical protein
MREVTGNNMQYSLSIESSRRLPILGEKPTGATYLSKHIR